MLVLCIYNYDYYGKRASSSIMVDVDEPKDIVPAFEKKMNERLAPPVEGDTKVLRGPAPIDYKLEQYLPRCGKDSWVLSGKEKKSA